MISLRRKKVEYRGECLTIPQWRDKLGLTISSACLYSRIFQYNWPVERAFTERKHAVPYIRYKAHERPLRNKIIDHGVEIWQELMLARGYFRKENRIKAYKQLKKDYEYFKAQDRMRIAV